MPENERKEKIGEIFEMLKISSEEERKKYTFGASLLDDRPDNKFYTEHIVIIPSQREVL